MNDAWSHGCTPSRVAKSFWRGEEQRTKLREIEEKPTYRHQVNAGIYALDAKLLSLLEKFLLRHD